MDDYFSGLSTGTVPPSSSPKKDYFSGLSTGTNAVVKEQEPELKTDKGTSLIPIPGSSFFDLFSKHMMVQGLSLDALSTAKREELAEKGIGSDETRIAKAGADVFKTLELFKAENLRIENVLKDKFGDIYQGEAAVGGLTFNDRDTLQRRNTFARRRAAFKRLYPDGEYIRTNVGGRKVEELYRTTKKGKLYRVDPSGGFSDLAGDFGDFTGTFLTAATAGSIIGSWWGPYFGTMGGALIGQMLDDYLTDEGVDVEFKNGKEFLDTFTGDKLLQANVEAAINKFAPGMGRYLVNRMKGEPVGVPYGLDKRFAEKAKGAQVAAESLNLPKLTALQLSNSPVFRKLGSQIFQTSTHLQKTWTKQQKALWNKVQKEVEGNFENAGQTVLANYLQLGKQDIRHKFLNFLKQKRKNTDAPFENQANFEQIVKSIDNYKIANDKLIEINFQKAFQSVRKNNVGFNIQGIVSKADEVLNGIQIKLQEKVGGNNVYERIGGELQGDLKNLITQLKRADPNVKTIAVTKFDEKKTYDSLKQMLEIRNKLQRIAKEGGGDRNAIDLIKMIDDSISNPVGVKNNSEFMKYLTEARLLVKNRSNIANFSALAGLFDKTASINYSKTIARIFDGSLNAEDVRMLKSWMNVTEEGLNKHSSKKVLQEASKKSIIDFQDGFIHHLFGDMGTAAKKINAIDEELLNELVPSKQVQAKLKEFARNFNWLDESSGAVKALDRKLLNSEAALANITNSSKADIVDQLRKMGGIDSPFAQDLRSAIFARILNKPNMTKMYEGRTLLDAKAFAKEMDLLSRGAGDYANLTPLFTKDYLKKVKDYKLYSLFTDMGGDTGADLAAAEHGGALRKATIRSMVQFVRTQFTSNRLAEIMAKIPTINQLHRAQQRQRRSWKKNFITPVNDKLAIFTSFFTSLERENNLLSDTAPFSWTDDASEENLTQEYRRTKEVPVMTDKVSSNTITPNTLNLNLPNVSSGGGTVNPPTKSTTNYASLFPFDTTGRTISDRQGIMGLA